MIVCELYKINTITNAFEHDVMIDGSPVVESKDLDPKIFDRLEKLGSAYHNGLAKYND